MINKDILKQKIVLNAFILMALRKYEKTIMQNIETKV